MSLPHPQDDRAVHYGRVARILHWLIAALVVAQFAIGWLMPDVHRGPPGTPMVLHISLGVTALALMAFRLAWRIAHPVGAYPSLPPWQRMTSHAAHGLLYLLVFATTLSGWLFTSFRGWSVRYFELAPLPMLWGKDNDAIRLFNGWHQIFVWCLLGLVVVHFLAALVHAVVYRDGVLQRMLRD